MFGYQESGERPQFRGIPLVLQSESIDEGVDECYGGYFYTRERFLPDLGHARIGAFGFHNEKEEWFEDYEISLGILDSKLVRKRWNSFHKGNNMYWAEVYLRTFDDLDYKNMTCQILLPDCSVISSKLSYTDPMDFYSVTRSCEIGEEECDKYSVLCATRWSASKNGKELPFFIPRDTDFLSSLRFSFNFSLRAPEVKPIEE